MTRFVDRGAVIAGWVGVGMAVVVAISFLLVIPIEPIYWVLALPAGLLIGYYANARSGRRTGPVRRIAANALYAGVVTGLAFVILLLAVKALFFFADDGYRDAGRLVVSRRGDLRLRALPGGGPGRRPGRGGRDRCRVVHPLLLGAAGIHGCDPLRSLARRWPRRWPRLRDHTAGQPGGVASVAREVSPIGQVAGLTWSCLHPWGRLASNFTPD